MLFSPCAFDQLHIPPPAVTTMPMGPVCSECGIIRKSSRKFSCCAPGGSWFENCGRFSNADLEHTWYEGVQACKAQYHVVMGQQMHAFQPKRNDTASDDVITDMDSKAVIVTSHMLASMRAQMPTPMTSTRSIATAPCNLKVYDAGTTTFNALTIPISTITRTLAKISTTRKTIILPINGTNRNSTHSSLNDIPTTSWTHTPVSASVTTRACLSMLSPLMLAQYYRCLLVTSR